MKLLRHLRLMPVVLGGIAAATAIGTSLFGDIRPGSGPARPGGGRPDTTHFTEDLAVSKFSQLPVLTYQPRDGAMLFAWQVRAPLEGAARPRDILVLVDTTASQAGKPLRQARAIIEALGNVLDAQDRLSVWTVSTPEATKPLTRGFFAPQSPEVREAAATLTELEYGSGAADLKGALSRAIASIPANPARTQAILLLGDGESAFQPLSEADRLALGGQLDARDILFFAVPLGLRVNAANLHGLAVLSGGAVVRLQENLEQLSKRNEFARRLLAAIDVPVLKVEQFQFGPEVAEAYPTRLPPLRADRGTLVVGKIGQPAAAAIHLQVKGYVGRREVHKELSVALPPPQHDHYFLNLMVEQWQSTPHKHAPAMLQSDRALALASAQVKLYREEYLTQAAWAINLQRWDDAAHLFRMIQKLDPQDREAEVGLKLLEQFRAGRLTLQELQRRFREGTGPTPQPTEQPVATAQDPKGQPPQGQPPRQGEPSPAELLEQQLKERRVAEDQARLQTQAAIREARQRLRIDPDRAYEDLKRLRDALQQNALLSDVVRQQLVADAEAAMRDIWLKGEEIKRQAEFERQLVARSRQRLNALEEQTRDDNRIQFRIDQFRQLMQQARFELAYQEAQLLRAERINAGQPVPVTATASYMIGQAATQLREWRELVRIREDRFLISLMQTEKSAIPYPDEPPIHYPPAAVWRELTSLRREAYLHSNLGPNPPQSQIDLKNKIENDEVRLPDNVNINDQTLNDLINLLSKQHGINFVIMEQYFKAIGVPDIKDKRPNLAATSVRGMKLGDFLDIVLLSMDATFIVRPTYVEITTFERRLEEKVTRVFPVADLAIPIPNAVNQQMLWMNLFFQNSALAIYGAVLGAQNFYGFGGAFGQLGQFGQAGVPPGLGQFGQFQGGNQMFGPDPFNQNLGVGGGGLQIGGGMLGQFGNLGGQFGLQGGDQSRLLMELIVETVARGEWLQTRRPGPGGLQPIDDEAPILDTKQLNSIGYYPPARALLIRGTHRYHPASSIKLKPQGAGGQVRAPGEPRGGPIVIGPAGQQPAAGAANAQANPPAQTVAAGEKPKVVDPRYDPAVLKPKLSKDPRRMWNEAVDWTVEDPGLIVASAEFLMEMDEYSAAAELLKAGLRKGLTTEAWTHEALAIALQLSQASPEEVLRAQLAAMDLEPNDPQALLRAAQAMAENKKFDLAIAFCKRAAAAAPDEPLAYANALAYAERAGQPDSDAVLWAGRNLLGRDWNTDEANYHQQARSLLQKLLPKIPSDNPQRPALDRLLAEQTRRDLTIELIWQGPADLDLYVEEPCGSVCSPTHKRTVGGGVLKADVLHSRDGDRSEVYTAPSAFSGEYRVRVRCALGRPVGNRATLRVTMHQGTPRERVTLHEIDLNKPETVLVHLEHGSRTTLAEVRPVTDERPILPTRLTSTGFSGAAGRPGTPLSAAVSTAAPGLPLTAPLIEKRLAGVGAAAELRGVMKYNPDRGTVSLQVNPVFTGRPRNELPRLSLLPGGDGQPQP